MERTFARLLLGVLLLGCSGERSVVNRGDENSGGHAGEGPVPGDAGLDAAIDGATDAGNWAGIDVGDCEERPEGDCTGIRNEHGGISAFDGAPALSECSMFFRPDGCFRLELEFDANGCAVAFTQGVEINDELRTCVTDVLDSGRFSCLESMRLLVHETCFIH